MNDIIVPGRRRLAGNAKAIKQFFHCAACEDSLPAGLQIWEWMQLECGPTDYGFQVWCRRHDVNIVHIDFLGNRLPGNIGGRARAWQSH